MTSIRNAVLLLFLPFLGPTTPPASAQSSPAPVRNASNPDVPELRIESFGPARAYAVGTETLTLVGTIRNVGKTALPANILNARMVCVAGLDYFEGDTIPKLPALEPDAAVTFRWRVQPTGPDVPLIASLAVEFPGRPPEVRVLAVQHFPEAPPVNGSGVVKAPSARVGRDVATLENDRVRVRIVSSVSNVPALLLAARTSGGWRQAGVSLPLAEALSAEGGQVPWWEVFRMEGAKAVSGKGEASLVLTGGIGLRWRATLVLTLRAFSSTLDARLQLAPLRPVKLSGLRLLPLMTGDGSFGATVSETFGPEATGPQTITAVRWGEITVGLAWPNELPFPEWQGIPLAAVEGADYRVLGVEMRTDGPSVPLQTTGMAQTRVRLFALTPSRSVEEARRITLPSISPK